MSITEIITWPFAWLLRTFFEIFGNYGIALILFAAVIKLISLPFQMKSKRSTMRSTRLAPLQKELEKKYGDDKQKYQEAVSKLYKDEGVNPMSGCLWSLLPIVIIFLLYPIIRQPLTSLMGISAEALEAIKNLMTDMGETIPTGAFAEIQIAEFIHENFSAFAGISDKLIDMDFNFLGLNLGEIPQWQVWNFDWSDSAVWGQQLGLFFLPVVSAVMSYLSMKISMASNPAAATQQGSMKGMQLMGPIMSLWIGFVYPAAMVIYWLTNSVLTTIQDIILNRHYSKILDAEDAERNARFKKQEEELERKRLETERLRELGETEKNRNTSKKKIQAAEKTKNDERLAETRAAEKAARKAALGITDETLASQVGTRRYARGRAYVDDRFINPEEAEEATRNAAELSEIDEREDGELDAQESPADENSASDEE